MDTQPTACSVSLGLDPAGVGDGVTTGVATTIVLETDVPAGVTFSAPTTAATGINAGTLTVGQVYAFWIKREVIAETRATIDSNNFKIGVYMSLS